MNPNAYDSTAARRSRAAPGKMLPPLLADVLQRMEGGEPLHVACGLWKLADGEARLSVLTWIDLHTPALAAVQANGEARFVRLILEELPKFRTTAAYISGAICGRMYWPQVKGGKPHRVDVRPIINRFSESAGTTFRDILESDIAANGGDFQNARYTADTVLRIERRRVDGNGGYRVHVLERPLSALRDCSDYVDPDSNTVDFLDEE
jgi:hypothetical protein